MHIAYILDSFPNTSETFISDEIHSVVATGQTTCEVFSLRPSRSSVIHPRAQDILVSTAVTYCSSHALLEDLVNLGKVLRKKPGTAFPALACALRSGHQRWLARTALQISASILRSKATHLHAHFADQAAQVAMWVNRFTGIPFTFTTHGYDVFFHPPSNYYELAAAAKSLICVSRFNKDYIASQFGISLSKMEVVRCGIYLDEFPFVERKPVDRNCQIKLLNVGRLVHEKGQCHLLDAIPAMLSRGLDVHLFVIGSGPLDEELSIRTKSLGIDTRVTFMGAQPASEVRCMLQQSDIFILSSISEAMPIVNMEAMASGIPLISTSVRGIPELVIHEVTGLLCEPSDPAAIAVAVEWMADHPEQTIQMTRSARATIEAQFDRLKCTAQLLTLWTS